MTAASLTLDVVADADVPALTGAACERPTRINIANVEETQQRRSSSRDSSSTMQQQQQQQLASPITPTSATLSPSGSAIMSPTSSFLPEMPQWKKDLIQRRKTNAARNSGAGVGGTHSPLLSPLQQQQQQLFRAGHESDGSHSPTKDFSTIKSSMQYTAKVTSNKNVIKTTITNQSTSQQQQQHFFMEPQKQQQQEQQKLTAEEQQLQQKKIAKQNIIKTPASHTAISEEKQQQQQQQSEEDVDPVISPTTKEEMAEKFIGGHSTPQVSMDASAGAEVETSASPSTNAAPIPKQRSLFVAPIKLLSSEEPDSCTNSSATASPSTATRLTSSNSSSSSSPTTSMVTSKEQQSKQQKIIKSKVEKTEATTTTVIDAELQETVKEEELIAETTTKTTDTIINQQHTHYVKSLCGTYSSSASTTSTPPPPPALAPQSLMAIVGKSTTGTTTGFGSSCGSPYIQSHSSNESEKSFDTTTATTFGTSALLSTTTTITVASKKFDIEKSLKEKSSPKISTKLQNNQFIKNQAVSSVNSGTGGGGATSKYIKFRATQESNDNSGQTPKTTANQAAIKKKMVAVQEMKKTTTSTNHHMSTTTTMCNRQTQPQVTDFDASEDLSYGPGIVSKLRCRYLSLALRESMEKQRHALDTLRRATSLNNLLDRDDQLRKHVEEDEDEEEDDVNCEVDYGEDQENLPPRPATVGGILRGNNDGQQTNVTKKTATFQKFASSANAPGRMSKSQGDGGSDGVSAGENGNNKRSRHIKRGNDSLKRARSVEALLCEKSPWNFAFNRGSLDQSRQPAPTSGQRSANTVNVTIEDKINNARERLVLGTDVMPPRRLTSIIDDTERPPPDLVKQTLKKFEATANKRGRGVNRAQGNGDVANKVANYRSIIKEQKPAIMFPKPPALPQSPTKKPIVKMVAKTPVLGAADLISSPIGRKTAAVAATSNSATVGSPLSSGFQAHVAETSTPKPKQIPGAADVGFTPPPLKNATPLSVVSSVAGGLVENSPDIIPRHNINSNKLLSETAAGGGVGGVVDSPVTALTKKLEKLRIDADKQNQQQQQQQQHVTAKEFQAKPNQQQQQQQQQEQQHDLPAGFDKFVGGDAAPLAADKHHNSNGTRSKNNKQKIIGSDGGDSDKNTYDDDDDDGGDDSDVHEEYDFVEIRDRCVEAESVEAGTGSASSDLSDNEYGTVKTIKATTKRVSKKALDNIAKAGTSLEFRFATKTTTTTTATGKQIGVIRPLHQLPASNTTSSSSNSNSSSTYASTNSSSESFSIAKSSTNNNNQQQQHMETLRSHQQQTYTLSHTNTHTINTHTINTHAHHHPTLTSREIEKNRINEMKKTATVASNAAAATDAATSHDNTTATSLDTVIATGASSISSSSGSSSSSIGKISSISELDAAATVTHNSSPLWALQTKKKRQPPAVAAENNSMVFNFSNRKEVPDYIENDGVVIRRKRELPKPNESGFVLLGDLSLETSTDSDYDDFSLCPPSPCDVEFENANIVIDGKSSIRQKPKEATFRVQFNDTLTSTFEYPSEASLVVDDSVSDRYANDNFLNSYENLVLEPTASLTQTDSSSPKHHHHVKVDEIIPIPINTAATGAANNSTTTTKMLSSLPLDSLSLPKDTILQSPRQHGERTENEITQQPQRPTQLSLPTVMSRATVTKPNRATAIVKDLKDPITKPRVETAILKESPNILAAPKKTASKSSAIPLKSPTTKTTTKSNIVEYDKNLNPSSNLKPPQILTAKENLAKSPTKSTIRRTPSVLSQPKYACFLKNDLEESKRLVQRSRSNEFNSSNNSKIVASKLNTKNSELSKLNANVANRSSSFCYSGKSQQVKQEQKLLPIIALGNAATTNAASIFPATATTIITITTSTIAINSSTNSNVHSSYSLTSSSSSSSPFNVTSTTTTSTTTTASSLLVSPTCTNNNFNAVVFSSPLAHLPSNALLRTRIPGNTLYYV